MPAIDMPLNELYQYQGINPKPQDFDNFWDDALKEIKAIHTNVEITPADFNCAYAECYDLYFTGIGGARIYAKFLKPKQIKNTAPAIIEFHGYGYEHRTWMDKLPYVAEGFCVFSMDCRGQSSGKSEDVGGVKGNTLHGDIVRGLSQSGQHLLYRSIFLDTATLAQIVFDFDFIDPKQVYTMGGSQGGALSLACAALEPRIAKTASSYPFLSDYKRVWEMDLCKDAYKEILDYFRWNDPRHQKETEIFTTLGYIDIQNLMPRIRGKVQMYTGLADTICPPSTQFAAYNKITTPKTVYIYPDYGHEFLPESSEMTFDFFVHDQFQDIAYPKA